MTQERVKIGDALNEEAYTKEQSWSVVFYANFDSTTCIYSYWNFCHLKQKTKIPSY